LERPTVNNRIVQEKSAQRLTASKELEPLIATTKLGAKECAQRLTASKELERRKRMQERLQAAVQTKEVANPPVPDETRKDAAGQPIDDIWDKLRRIVW